MKILVVTQYFWPEEFRINDICKGLTEKGHEIEVLTGLPNYPQGKFFEGYSFFKRGSKFFKGIKINRSYLVPRGKNSAIKLALNYLSFMICSLPNISKLLFKRFDKIFVYQVSPITTAVPAIIISKIKKIPSTIYIQDLWPETLYSIMSIQNKYIRSFFKKVCVKIYNSFDLLLIASKGYKEILVSEGINPDKIVYLPQWAESVYLDKEIEKINNIKESQEDFVVTFAGNIGKAQSVDTIIEAARLCQDYKNIKWTILGDGSEFNNIQLLVEKYQLKNTVMLLGRKPSSDMPIYFSQSDALIVTLKDSHILKITLPAKVQSYMASGKPILGAISGEGMNVIKESNCGLVCEADDFKGLCDNVIKLYKMTNEERNILGKNGEKYFINNFERKMLLDNLESYLLDLNKYTDGREFNV